jgi:hypothetical protein
MDLARKIPSKITRLAAAAWLCGALPTGCASEPDPEAGVLVVPFALGNHKSCEELGITDVRAELDDGFLLEEVRCDAGEVRFDNLDPGTYAVKLFGLDAEGFPAMDSVESGERVVRVLGNNSTVVADPEIVLSAAPAHLQVRWDFGFGSCEGAAVHHFGVDAWRVDGSELLLQQDLSCGMPGEGDEQYRLVPDPDRQLGGDQLGEVSVQAFDKNGFGIGEPAMYSFEAPGAGRDVNLSLECDDAGCVGSGEPD